MGRKMTENEIQELEKRLGYEIERKNPDGTDAIFWLNDNGTYMTPVGYLHVDSEGGEANGT